jgi:hypothetical protein
MIRFTAYTFPPPQPLFKGVDETKFITVIETSTIAGDERVPVNCLSFTNLSQELLKDLAKFTTFFLFILPPVIAYSCQKPLGMNIYYYRYL